MFIDATYEGDFSGKIAGAEISIGRECYAREFMGLTLAGNYFLAIKQNFRVAQ